MEAIHSHIERINCFGSFSEQASIAIMRPAFGALQCTGVLLYPFGGKPNSFANQEQDNNKKYQFRN